jgi:two-component system sensor histidine kinase HydH
MAPSPPHLVVAPPGMRPPGLNDGAPSVETSAGSPPPGPPPPVPENPAIPAPFFDPWPPPQGLGQDKPVVLEFEPTFAAALIGRSQRNFALGLGAATLLAVVAVVLWRRAQREEAMAERRAQNERLAALGTMSAVLAHEIKNPLAALKGNAQLVAEALPDGSRRRAQAERVVEASIRLQELVTNLLDFVRGGPISRAPVDPAELLFLAAEDAAPKAELELEAAPPSWSLDSVRIRQVLENLLRNAAQAAEGGRVWASVLQEGNSLIYSVRDEGPGLPAGPKEAIFEPFFTTKTRGVGLGLTVARRIAELHGGELTARNRPDGGAEFRVVIPLE